MEIVRFALHDRGDALEARSGIHRRLWERHQRSIGLPIELHEDEVPELEEPSRLRSLDERILREFLALDLGPLALGAGRKRKILGDVREVDKDLGARTAGTRVRHLPEVVVRAESVDARVRESGDLAPESARLVVLLEHGDADVLRLELQLLGHELPGEADRIALEVVAEGEIAEHLEERVMPRGVADLLEVVVLSAGPHALLHGRGATRASGRLLLAEEHLLELHHPRVREHQRRVVAGHDRRAGMHQVPLLLKVRDEFLADFGGLHARKYTRCRCRASTCISACGR